MQLISRKTPNKKIGTSTVGSISKQSTVRTDISKRAMLKNFLDALEITGAIQKLKRVILTTGSKQYGVHLGPPKQPMEESDPWNEGPGRPPNFYYNQQRILADKAKHASWDWVVTYPNDVIGVANGNFMNLGTSIGI